MNYEGAPGLELGRGNTTVDPSVIKGLSQSDPITSDANEVQLYLMDARSSPRKNTESASSPVHTYHCSIGRGRFETLLHQSRIKSTGRNVVIAEYESMTVIHKLLSKFAPKPVAWGTYEIIPETHFLLSEYRDMILEMQDPDMFSARLAALHQESRSPEGKFAFHVATYPGNLPQYTGWEDSWEAFFAKSMR
jgi:protein-ribulosamine 3-kinase